MADIKDIKLGNTKYNIKIPSSRVKSMADYAKPSSKPSPEAIQQSDTLNEALGKLEYKADTNQTNILYALNKVGKNLLNPYTPDVTNYDTGRGITYTNNKDGTWYVAGTSTTNDAYINLYQNQSVLPWGLKTGDVIKITTNTNKVNVAIIPITSSGYGSTVAGNASTVGTLAITSDIIGMLVRFQVDEAGTVTNENVIGMICHEEAWNLSHDIELYGAPNSDLTVLEAEDRAALADEIDAGAKNLLNPVNVTEGTNAAWYSATGTVTQTVTDTKTWLDMRVKFYNNTTYVVAIPLETVYVKQNGLWYIEFTKNSTFNILRVGHNGSKQDFNILINVSNLENGKHYVFSCNILQCVQASGFYSFNQLMLCTKAAFGVSKAFIPYRPSYDDALFVLCERAPKSTDSTKSGGSMDDFDSGCVLCTSNVTGGPKQAYGYVRTRVYDSNCVLQQAFYPVDNTAYQRCKWAGTWSAWKQFIS